VLSNNYLLNYSFRFLCCRQWTTISAQQFSVREIIQHLPGRRFV